MNIFILDKDPLDAAQMLCDCHVRKMCLETAQILSGVMLRRGMKRLEGMPKPQNINHPVIVAADNDTALNWVLGYNYDLHLEYRRRFGKTHAFAEISVEYIAALWINCGDICCRKLAKCCGDLDVADLDIVTAYRKYYTEVKKPQLTKNQMWKFTNREDWTE